MGKIGSLVALVGIASYLINAYEFAGCDFKPDYKCEAIHGVGVVVPPTALITVWFDKD